MADSGEVSVKFKLHGDKKGADEIAGGISKVEQSAVKANHKIQSSTLQTHGAFNNLSQSVGLLRRALTGFGAVALFSGIISGIFKLKESFGAAKKSAEEFQKAQAGIKASTGLAEMEAAYVRLSDSISSANASQERALALIDRQVANRRKLDAAKLESAKERELAALDPNAADYDEQKAVIEQKYATFGDTQRLANEKEDLVLARQKLGQKASMKDREAAAQDEQTALLERRLADKQRARGRAELASVELNEADKTDAVSAVSKTLGQLFSGDWGRMAGAKTAEGDQVRQEAVRQMGQLDEDIIKLQEEIRRSNEKSAQLRSEAGSLRAESDSYSTALEAVELNLSTANARNRRSSQAATSALKDRQNMVSDAEISRRALDEEIMRQKTARDAELRKKSSAAESVYQAQGDLDAAKLRGDRKGAEAAYARLQSVQAAANETNYAADKALQSIEASIKELKRQFEAADNFLKKINSRQNYAWNEAAPAN